VSTSEEILTLAVRLEKLADDGSSPLVEAPIEALRLAAENIGRAASRSWLGHQANVYYRDLEPPPPGDHFSTEWGLKGDVMGRMGSSTGWREYARDAVQDRIKLVAGNPDLGAANALASNCSEALRSAQSELESLLQVDPIGENDAFVSKISQEFLSLSELTSSDVVKSLKPTQQVMTRDSVAVNQGYWTPPHIAILSEVAALSHNIGLARQGSDLLARLGSHLERREKRVVKDARVGTNVFIGHGRAGAWRELKDFISDRMGLPWDEFNRVPVAGVTNIARLAEMLDAAAIAFLVMTGEDEAADGTFQARMNVVHEAGLFQGRLGFTRAIVLLEDGCSEFSNIQGLGQIRFPKGRIGAAFEEVRQVLEREGLA
jgi:hypothetical protein